MADQSAGFFASLKRLLATLVATGKTRLELLGAELEEEKIRLTQLLVFSVAALVFLCIGMVLLVALVAAAFWESRIVIFAVFSLIFIGGGLALTAIGFLMGGALSPTAIAPAITLIIYMALISAVAYSLWSRLLAANPVSRVSVFGFMNPVFGVLLSALLLGEGAGTSPVTVIVALLLVCGGIIIVNKPKKA